jgi:hypothetical protein
MPLGQRPATNVKLADTDNFRGVQTENHWTSVNGKALHLRNDLTALLSRFVRAPTGSYGLGGLGSAMEILLDKHFKQLVEHFPASHAMLSYPADHPKLFATLSALAFSWLGEQALAWSPMEQRGADSGLAHVVVMPVSGAIGAFMGWGVSMVSSEPAACLAVPTLSLISTYAAHALLSASSRR